MYPLVQQVSFVLFLVSRYTCVVRVDVFLRVGLMVASGVALALLMNAFHPRSLSLTGVGVVISNAAQCTGDSQLAWTWIDTPSLQALLSQGQGATVVDLRSAAEFNKRHLPNAIHLSCQNREATSIMSSVSIERPVVFYEGFPEPSPLLREALRLAAQRGIRPLYVWKGILSEWPEQDLDGTTCSYCVPSP